MRTEALIADLNVPEPLLLEFFVAFSRFEFALKDLGYIRENRSYVAPDWWRYAEESAALPDPESQAELKEAIHYLSEYPPKSLINDRGTLVWRQEEFDDGLSVEERLIRRVKTVRNNLFHGSKFSGGELENPERNENLVWCSLIILEHLTQHDDTVGQYFP